MLGTCRHCDAQLADAPARCYWCATPTAERQEPPPDERPAQPVAPKDTRGWSATDLLLIAGLVALLVLVAFR